jgi:hypothetical protein
MDRQKHLPLKRPKNRQLIFYLNQAKLSIRQIPEIGFKPQSDRRRNDHETDQGKPGGNEVQVEYECRWKARCCASEGAWLQKMGSVPLPDFKDAIAFKMMAQ